MKELQFSQTDSITSDCSVDLHECQLGDTCLDSSVSSSSATTPASMAWPCHGGWRLPYLTYGEGGGLQKGKIAGLKLFAPPPLKTG